MECELKWALNYHIAKRGEFDNKPILLQHAWRLKHMKNVFLLFGELMHQMIEAEIKILLETGEVLSEAKIKKKLREMLNQVYWQSKYRANKWYKNPKFNQMLFEILYNGDLDEHLIQSIKEKMDKCISGFIQSETIHGVLAKRKVKVMEAEKFRSFYLDGVRVVLSADLIFYDEYNSVYGIVDWKTGKQSTNDRLQLAIYALYLEKNYGAEHLDIELTNEYLEEGINKNYIIDTYDIDHLQEIFHESSKRMTELEENLRCSDDEILKYFQKAENEKTCDWCNFKALCSDELRELHINNFIKGIG